LKGGDGAEMAQDARRWPVDDFLSRKITRNIPNLKAKKEETIMRKSKMKITILGYIVSERNVMVLQVNRDAKEHSLNYYRSE
jgi:hypothetical protein